MKTRITVAIVALMAYFAGLAPATAQINVFPSYYQDFESGGGGWTPGGQNSSWELGYPMKYWIWGTTSGSNCWTTSLYGTYNSGEYSYLTSPVLDFSCYTQNPTIQFSLSYYTEAYVPYAAGYDFCWVEYSTNGGSSWSVLGSAGTGSNWYQYNWYDWNYGNYYQAWGGDDYYGNGFGWLKASNTIPGVAGNNNVRIRFVMYADYSYELDGIAIDDINIYAPSPTLATPTLTNPANAATNLPVQPTMTWSASGCATGYDIQIADDAAFTSLVQSITNNPTTSFTPSTALAFGTTYYWRTRARSATLLSAWTTARTFTTMFPPPPTPVLASPADNATGQLLTSSLQWNPSFGAASYLLQVSTDPTFATTVVDQTLTGTSYNFTASANFTRYYWRVNATNVSGTSPWSATWNYRTIIGTPNPATPATGVKGLTTPVVVTWTPVTGAVSYDVQASTNSSFSTVDINLTSSGTTGTLSGLKNNTQYFWRVRAAADAVEKGVWSTVWSFSTIVGTPGLAKPFDGSLDLQPLTVTLSWNAVEGEATYRVQVSPDLLFNTLVVDKINVAGTTLDVTGLQNNTLYYWRVQASNITNGMGSWSTFFTFNTIVGKVTGAFPANGQKGVPLPVPIQWTSAGNGKTYQIQVATDAQFKNIVITDERIGEVTGSYGRNVGLNNYTTYYWRVRPLAQTNVQVPWSDVMSFVSNIGAPTLASPANNAVNQPVAPMLAWKAVAGATTYTVRIYEDDAAQTMVFENTAVAGTSVSPTGLQPEKMYLWRVQANDADGYMSEWSATWKFATTTVFAAVPALDKPANNTADATPTTTLEWKAADYAQTYDVQVSSYSNFSSTIVNLTGVNTMMLPVSGLANGERYFWRVRSVNAAGASAWSETWTFVVSPLVPVATMLVSPGNGATDQPYTSVGLRWNDVAGATSYQLQVADNNTFATTLLDKSNLPVTSYPSGGLKEKTTYYWRVRAKNAIGEGAWSEVWAFTTGQAPSGAEEELASAGIRLEVVYPNPTAHTATVGLTLARPANAVLTVVNNLGQTVATLATGDVGEGAHSFVWDAALAPAGQYAVRLTVGGAMVTRMVNVVK